MLHWKSDKWFGIQRVQGVNPTLITLCTKIPDKSVTDVYTSLHVELLM